jgi:hypothetical protein
MNAIRTFEVGVSKLLFCGAILLGATGVLSAGETLTLKNGVTTGTGTPISNFDVFSGTVGNWAVSVTQGTDLGTPSNPNLDLLSVDTAKVANPGDLTVTFTDTGFTLTPLTLTYSDSSSFLDVGAKSSVSDTIQILVNGKVVTGTTVVLDPGSQAVDGTAVTIKPGSSYSITLTEVVTDSKGPGVEVSSDILVGAQTPEPGFYALTGVGLAGLLALAIRRKKLKATA